MELELFFSNSKWEILSELSKGPKSPLELANIFKTSVANISQQLRLMEAADVVEKTKVQNFQKGKPRTLYVVRLGKNFASKKLIKKDPFTSYLFNVVSIISKKDQYFLFKFFFDNSDILADSSISVFKNSDKAIELFIITEKLDEARKRISNTDIINLSGNTKKIVCWSHNALETQQGIRSNDLHFLNLTKESVILLDDKGTLEKFKELVKK